MKANQKDSDFEDSELSRLTTVNWKNEGHQRSITASLVQGVYALEYGRQKNRQVCKSWWEFFDYQLMEKLTDDRDFSIFGAVYEFERKPSNNYCTEAPRYVIAFRGTMVKRYTFTRDMKLNIKILLNRLHRASCIGKAIEAVKRRVSVTTASTWLAGHSLGSAVAMLAGKNMAMKGKLLTMYLFNPPFVSFPVKRRILVATSWVKAAITVFLRDGRERQDSEKKFSDLSEWAPKLFLHQSDCICSGYIRYFELQEKMESSGVGDIGRLAAQNSMRGLVMKAFGMKYFSEELHLIPSACVSTSSSPKQQAHNLNQWFKDDSVPDPPKVYRYKVDEASNLNAT